MMNFTAAPGATLVKQRRIPDTACVKSCSDESAVKCLDMNFYPLKLSLLTLLAWLTSCSQPLTVAVNNQAVYDPRGRMITGNTIEANLQGCINYAVEQQGLDSAAQLTVLSCANAELQQLTNIGNLSRLRFLDLGDNNITNITPLEDLGSLSGLNLSNNGITDISPLFNIQTLTTVRLTGNNRIPCSQIATLRERLGNNLTAPDSCRS